MADAKTGAQTERLKAVVGGERLVAVVRASRASDCEPVVETLVQAGICIIELTLTTPGAIDELQRLRDRFGTAAVLGMGTVLTRQSATQAMDAGAQFVVTPVLVRDVIDEANSRDVPVLSGALSPTEIYESIICGADAVKIFPASAVGPRYLRELSGPFPGITLMPSGGVEIDDIPAWLSAGALAVSLGGSLIKNAFDGELSALRERALRAVAASHEAQ
jgi:2-dehydro-3-deoxyphosphogluconate aldolase/(4S)-4-hydroxy-2-oxoglutarate aldolase